MAYSSVSAAGRFVDGSADSRNGLFRESLISSSIFSVMVAENNMVCLLLGHNFTYSALAIIRSSKIEWQIPHEINTGVKIKQGRKTICMSHKYVIPRNKIFNACFLLNNWTIDHTQKLKNSFDKSFLLWGL